MKNQFSGFKNPATVKKVKRPPSILDKLDNPFGQAVRVLSVDIEVTTQGAASGTMCVGIGSSATADYATMFSVLPCDNGTTYPYFWNSTKTCMYPMRDYITCVEACA